MRHPFIERIRALGVQVALDECGVGASSIGCLKNLPVDVLKIDGQFVVELLEDPLADAALRSFVDVARVVGATIPAECVERGDVLERLHELGVRGKQGYLIHRPEPLDGLLSPALSSGS